MDIVHHPGVSNAAPGDTTGPFGITGNTGQTAGGRSRAKGTGRPAVAYRL